jgi:hypothetical protein
MEDTRHGILLAYAMLKKRYRITNLLSSISISILTVLFVFSFVSLLNPMQSFAQSAEPRGAAAMSAFDRLPYIKTGTTVKQVGSFNRDGSNNDNTAFSMYRHSSTLGYVVLEEYAPGTIYRIWATGLNGGNIRMYFDGETTPRINMPVTSFFSGATVPFRSPLVGNDTVSSGGFYSYYPISYQKSVRVEFTNVPTYYNIAYHTYNSADNVTTYSGTENLTAAYNAWNNPAQDPKSTVGNQTTNIGTYDLAAGSTKQLLNLTNTPGSIRSLKLTFPQFKTTQTQGTTTSVTDNGRAYTGNASFKAAIESSNSGVILTRRFDYGIPDQVADVYVDGALVGRWSNPGSDATNRWRDSDFTIPANFTQGKTQITVRVQFVSSWADWNEFYYWVKTIRPNDQRVQTDTVDVGDAASETAHAYAVVGQTFEGTRTFTYPGSTSDVWDGPTLDVLSNARIQMFWDGESTPSVDVPLGYFFGVGSSGEAKVQGLLMGVDPATHTFYNYFPMPFNQSARIQLVNNSQQTITEGSGVVQHSTTALSGLGTNAGYFVTQFKRENPTTTNRDFVWADFPSGTGQVVGSILNISNIRNDGVLEGDERVFIDQNTFTSTLHGTGTEDYFNGGWYFNRGIFSLPVHGAPLRHELDGTQHMAMYRLGLADSFPFEKSLRLKIEHGGANELNAQYEGAVFAYLIKNKESIQQSDKFTVGNTAEQAAHNYSITSQTFSGNFSDTYFGRDDGASFSGSGKAHRGTSQFKMYINPNNRGVRLARIFDFGIGNQKARVYVDNVLVGTWFNGGINATHRAGYDTFEIPASFTQGKSSIVVRVQYVSSNQDWNEFVYYAYSHLAPTSPDTTSPVTAITSPANGARVSRNTNVTISANATDNIGVQRVEFLVNNTYRCTDTTAPYSCSWTVPNTTGTNYTLQVKAYDNAGNNATNAITVTSR